MYAYLLSLAITVAIYLLVHRVRKSKPTTYAVFFLPLLAIPMTVLVIIVYLIGCDILPSCEITWP